VFSILAARVLIFLEQRRYTAIVGFGAVHGQTGTGVGTHSDLHGQSYVHSVVSRDTNDFLTGHYTPVILP
jgi:hypothetical protein